VCHGRGSGQEQEHTLVRVVGTDGRVVLAFDDDEAGYNCTNDVLVRLGRQCLVKATTFDEMMEEFG
jgi:hypothetical protein